MWCQLVTSLWSTWDKNLISISFDWSETHRLAMFPSRCGRKQRKNSWEKTFSSLLKWKSLLPQWIWGYLFVWSATAICPVNLSPDQSCHTMNKNPIVPISSAGWLNGNNTETGFIAEKIYCREYLLRRIGKCVAIAHVIFFSPNCSDLGLKSHAESY